MDPFTNPFISSVAQVILLDLILLLDSGKQETFVFFGFWMWSKFITDLLFVVGRSSLNKFILIALFKSLESTKKRLSSTLASYFFLTVKHVCKTYICWWGPPSQKGSAYNQNDTSSQTF